MDSSGGGGANDSQKDNSVNSSSVSVSPGGRRSRRGSAIEGLGGSMKRILSARTLIKQVKENKKLTAKKASTTSSSGNHFLSMSRFASSGPSPV